METGEQDLPTAVFEALLFAGHVHNGQRRKDAPGSPHLKHLVQVAGLLVRAGVRDPDVLRAAVLHDVLRDTDVEVAELQERFGERVSEIVLELSEDARLSRLDRREYMPRRVTEFGEPAKLIKLAEKISNLLDLAEHAPIGWSRQRRRNYFSWADGVTRPLRDINPELDAMLDQALQHVP